MRLSGEVPGDFEEFSLKLTMGSKSENYSDGAKQSIVVFRDFKERLFALAVISSGEEVIKLYARPKTLKLKSGSGGVKASFDGIMNGRRPGLKEANSAKDYIHNMKVRCTFHYGE